MNEEETNTGFLAPGATPETGPELSAVNAVAQPREAAENSSYGGVEGSRPAAGEAPAQAETAPDDFALDWPEGYTADPDALRKFAPLARELGLGRDKAQKLATLYAELDQERNRRQAEFVAKNNAEWLKEIHGHPEFGGEALARTAENVAATMRRFGTPLLIAQVRQMNIQNWPEMFFFLARVSQAASEDCSPSGGATEAPARSAAQILFPGLK
jgi:hypothetical protein